MPVSRPLFNLPFQRDLTCPEYCACSFPFIHEEPVPIASSFDPCLAAVVEELDRSECALRDVDCSGDLRRQTFAETVSPGRYGFPESGEDTTSPNLRNRPALSTTTGVIKVNDRLTLIGGEGPGGRGSRWDVSSSDPR